MMEILEVLYNLMALVVTVWTTMSMGLSLTIKQVVGPLRNARFVIMALLVNFVVVPAAAYVLTLVIAPTNRVILMPAAEHGKSRRVGIQKITESACAR